MKKGSNVIPRFNKTCTNCNKDYLGRQHNSKLCDNCRQLSLLPRPRKSNLGKTYEQIYGKSRDQITNGFKKGKDNPNYTRPKFIGCVLENSRNEKFRSSLEVRFSEFCIQHNIKYEYEKKVDLINNKLKIVDFVLEDRIYVEISGFAHESWQNDFITKMEVLAQTITNPILILTYKEHLESIKRARWRFDTYIEDISNEKEILRIINFIKQIDNTNKIIFNAIC